MRIDSFIEWFVILCGVIVALSTLFPGPAEAVGQFLAGLIPHPDRVNEWLRRWGL